MIFPVVLLIKSVGDYFPFLVDSAERRRHAKVKQHETASREILEPVKFSFDSINQPARLKKRTARVKLNLLHVDRPNPSVLNLSLTIEKTQDVLLISFFLSPSNVIRFEQIHFLGDARQVARNNRDARGS